MTRWPTACPHNAVHNLEGGKFSCPACGETFEDAADLEDSTRINRRLKDMQDESAPRLAELAGQPAREHALGLATAYHENAPLGSAEAFAGAVHLFLLELDASGLAPRVTGAGVGLERLRLELEAQPAVARIPRPVTRWDRARLAWRILTRGQVRG